MPMVSHSSRRSGSGREAPRESASRRGPRAWTKLRAPETVPAFRVGARYGVLTVVCLQRHDPDVRLVMHTMVVVGTAVAALTSCGETSRRPHTPSNPQAARGGQAGDADAGSTASEAGTVAFGGATSLGGAGSAGDGLTAGGCATHALGLDDCDCSAEWLQLIDAGSSDRATSIAADSLGNLGVVGSTVDASQQHVGWLRGYGSDGGELWVETLTLGDNVLVSDVAAAPDGGWVVGGAARASLWHEGSDK
jgi:hypothetical protein